MKRFDIGKRRITRPAHPCSSYSKKLISKYSETKVPCRTWHRMGQMRKALMLRNFFYNKLSI